jgi:hydroxypyruvate reductase
MVKGLTEDDLVIALISGGGSSLLSLLAPGLTLEDKQAVNRALLRSGAHIGEMNTVRKHLSAIKGGRLAAAAVPAQVVTLVISDVPADDPAVIASGPTIADATTFAEARAVLAKYGITEPEAALRHLERAENETPKPGDRTLRFDGSDAGRAAERVQATCLPHDGRLTEVSGNGEAKIARCS